MPNVVRIRLGLPHLKLQFSGSEECFQRLVEPFLLAAAGRPTPEKAAASSGDRAATSHEPAPEPTNGGYVPPSMPWGLFHRQTDLRRLDGAGPGGRIAAYAFFLWNYEKMDAFGPAELDGCFRAEGLPPPDDAPDLLADLAERRILAADGEGRWRITPRGVAHVRKTLSA
jgi:hypothetical protein